MKTKILKTIIIASAVAGIGLTAANAIPTVVVSTDQGANWTTLGSSSTVVGSWRINATAFSTVGMNGQSPELGFSVFNATSRLPGILMVRLYDTGFQWGDTIGYYLSQIDGSVAGGSRLSVNTYVNAADPFTTGDLLMSHGNFLAGLVKSEAVNTSYGIPAGPFSMMFEATISQRVGGGIVTFKSTLVDPSGTNGVPDSGTTLLLFGLGLAALVIIKRVRLVSALEVDLDAISMM